MIHKYIVIILSFACGILVNALFLSNVSALDFDKDGIDDVMYVTINKDKSLSWRYRSSKSGKAVAIGRFGKSGDHLIPGTWLNADNPVVGTISKSQVSTTLWSLNSTDSNEIEFGQDEDLSVSGVDLNGDGIFDPVSISIVDGSLKWDYLLGGFSKSSAAKIPRRINISNTSSPITLGQQGDLPFIWKINNKVSTFAVLKYDHGNNPQVQYLNANAQIKTVTLGRQASYNRNPFTAILANKTYIVLPSVERNKTFFSIFRANGKFLRTVSVPASGEVLVGDFSKKASGQELAVHSGKTLYFANLRNARVERVSSFQGIAVDAVNLNTTGNFANVPPKKLSASCKKYSPNDGYKRGFIWKPNSDTQRYAVVVMPNEFTNKISQVDIYSQAGDYIKSLPSKGCANPDDQGPRCAFQDKQYTGQEYRKIFGSIFLQAVKSDGSCAVFAITNPGIRTD